MTFSYFLMCFVKWERKEWYCIYINWELTSDYNPPYQCKHDSYVLNENVWKMLRNNSVENMKFLLNQTQVHSLEQSKANLLTMGCGEGKLGFRKAFLKARWSGGGGVTGYMIILCAILCLVDDEVTGLCHRGE